MKACAQCAASSVLALLVGCAADTAAIVQTVKLAVSRDTGADHARLNPDFRYLRVEVSGRVALLVLGYVDVDPRGPIEVWYSAEREVLKLQNGRVVGAVGMATEWRNVQLSALPEWSALAQGAVKAVRTRDVMPGYRYGVRDALEAAPVPAPRQSALRDLDATGLSWFEERSDALPVARYAVRFDAGRATAVYGEQCLAPELCFTWQRWPAGKSGSE